MLSSFLTFLESHQLLSPPAGTTLLAVSGGVDSTVLCHLFKRVNLPFAIIHCNFNLRAQEAKEEEIFVHNLAQEYGVPFYSRSLDTKKFASDQKISIQMAARVLRYQFFHTVATKKGYPHIATAHHWDDSVETILLNLIKGTSLKGLYGIPPLNGKVIRPLIFARKKEILAYAHAHQLLWKEDSSNQSLYYQRNLIRNKIIPLIVQLNPHFEETLKETAEKLNNTDKFFQSHIEKIKTAISSITNSMHQIAIDQIVHLPGAPIIAFELVRSYGFTFKQIKQIIKNKPASGKTIYSNHYLLYIDRKEWFIKKKESALFLASPLSIWKESPSLSYGDHIFSFRTYLRATYNLQKNLWIAALNYEQLQFPLTLRPWQKGDFFYPLGMKGRKKISDLLIDLKVALPFKKKVLVITSGHQIVWVVGYRIDERFKIEHNTTTLFEIAVQKT